MQRASEALYALRPDLFSVLKPSSRTCDSAVLRSMSYNNNQT